MAYKIIDLGVEGDNLTGDSLHDGGEKINDNFQEIFDKFSNQKLPDADRTIHASGFYQTYAPASGYFSNPLEAGSLTNVDTRSSGVNITLPNGRIGETVKLRDIYGSWNTNSVVVYPDGLEAINGQNSPVTFSIPNQEITFLCTNDAPVNWSFFALPIFGSSRVIDSQFRLTSGSAIATPLYDSTDITAMTLMINGWAVAENERTSQIAHVMTNDGAVKYSMYSILTSLSDDSLVYNSDFQLNGDILELSVDTTYANVDIHIKNISYTR